MLDLHSVHSTLEDVNGDPKLVLFVLGHLECMDGHISEVQEVLPLLCKSSHKDKQIVHLLMCCIQLGGHLAQDEDELVNIGMKLVDGILYRCGNID